MKMVMFVSGIPVNLSVAEMSGTDIMFDERLTRGVAGSIGVSFRVCVAL